MLLFSRFPHIDAECCQIHRLCILIHCKYDKTVTMATSLGLIGARGEIDFQQ